MKKMKRKRRKLEKCWVLFNLPTRSTCLSTSTSQNKATQFTKILSREPLLWDSYNTIGSGATFEKHWLELALGVFPLSLPELKQNEGLGSRERIPIYMLEWQAKNLKSWWWTPSCFNQESAALKRSRILSWSLVSGFSQRSPSIL